MPAIEPHEYYEKVVKPAVGKPTPQEILAVCRRIVAAQAEDGALWDPQTIGEAYVAQELRTLHRAVEGDLSVLAAIEDP
jgi:hypothetical protein